MGDLAGTAQRLREVRRAFENFLTLWAFDCMWLRRRGVERLEADLERCGGNGSGASMLYEGGVLDD